MLTIGIDAHKRIHAAVALDEAGRTLATWRGPNSPEGWAEVAAWAAAHAATSGAERRWGIEGAGHYGRGLAQYLVGQGETVYDINPRWTAAERQRARKPGKSDRLDARAVALVVWREAASLPPVQREEQDETAVLDLLVREREGALAEATRLRNQLHATLLHLDPQYKAHLPALTTPAGIAAAEAYTGPERTPLQRAQAASVRRLAQRLRLATEHAAALAQQIAARAQAGFSPLTRLKGINLLTAGALAGLLGPGRRFSSEAQLAAYAGVAPLEASSAGRVRHRLNRGGNRRLNAILYRIALTQARCWPPAQDYLARRLRAGKTKREAIRALKRYLIRAIWRLWQECMASHPVTSYGQAA
jgi:transposase